MKRTMSNILIAANYVGKGKLRCLETFMPILLAYIGCVYARSFYFVIYYFSCRFTQRANLDAHLRVHSGYKPHTCDYCGKAFSQKGNMEEHRRVHTGEKPFVCELCGNYLKWFIETYF